MSMFDEIAAEAAALAKMQTQVGKFPTAVKRSAVPTGADGGPVRCPKVVDE